MVHRKHYAPAYAVAHHMPCTRGHACKKFLHWQTGNAVWEGEKYTDELIALPFQPEGDELMWCTDAPLLRHMAADLYYLCLYVFVCVCLCATEGRLLASDMLCLSCLMTN